MQSYARPMGRFGGLAAMLFVLTAAPACVVDGPLGGQASDEWVRTYDLPPAGTLELRNRNGLIEVDGVDAPTVEVRAERIVKSTSDDAAREILGRLRISEDVQPDHVRIETEGLDGLVIGVSTEVRYHVRAPRALALDLHTSNGGIRLSGLEGAVVARTTNGGITGTDLAGGVEARTTNGGLRVDFARVGDDSIDLRATNGGVVLGLPETAAADLSLSATNGGVSVTGLPFEATGEQTRRRMKGRLNGGGPLIELSTTNGGVRVRNRSAMDADNPEP